MPTAAGAVTRCPYTFKEIRDPRYLQFLQQNKGLPADWGDSGTICIAMAGARASGKSLYIAVVVKQLARLLQKHHLPLIPMGDTGQRYRDHYEHSLFAEMGLLRPTPRMAADDAYHRDPLIFDIGNWDCGGGERKHYLVLRDVAGEDLEQLPDNPSALEFFQHADTVLFLFDPLGVRRIRTYLKGRVVMPHVGGDPVTVLNNLLRVLGGARPPLAVALSKFDTLQELEFSGDTDWTEIMANYGAAYRRDSDLEFGAADSHLLDAEIRSMLLRLNAHDVVYTIESCYRDAPTSFRYFATSALGAPPKGSRVDASKGIAPFRCLDPILWTLTRNGLRV
ncbi:hypothetical protein [Corynebacterium sp. TAE3-ERU12]|uniref:hypothetical protein n=1 Tax=Corynebacterium sp. TAE3-ERU12 TaxID=2849491 RepID=UPI00351DA754